MNVPTLADVSLYVFSFNRNQFLENCLRSIERCASGLNVTVIDDHSHDSGTRKVLARYKDMLRIIEPAQTKLLEHKTGGLYSNMRFAFRDAKAQSKKYALFLQDDMQIVRPIAADDMAATYRFFQANPNVAELHTCFMKRFYAEKDEACVILDASGEAYLRPSNYPGFSGFSAVGLFDVQRFEKLFGELKRGEYANNEYAQQKGIQMGLSAKPFMMWLPYPISHRGRRRNIPLKLVEGIAGCGFYPYATMQELTIQQFLDRDYEAVKPYAEDWLKSPSLRKAKMWSFAGGLSNLLARGGVHAWIGHILMRIKKTTGYL
jgi:hypothetical protein